MKIGQVIMLAESPRTKKAACYADVRSMALAAEEGGFDSIWLYDHLLYRKDDGINVGIWECWTMLSALAEATHRVELGTLVLCNSFRNPAILAKMAATLDEVSQGRFILGIGAGWNQPEYESFGLPFDHRVDRFEEALQVLCPLVREGKVDFKGKYYQAPKCEITPRGPSPKGPPVLVGCGGERMLRLTAKYADLWNIGYLGKPAALEPHRERMLAACRDVGRDPATLGITVLLGLWYPDLLPEKPGFDEEPLSGSDEEIAAALRGYEQMGVAQVMFHIVPYSREALDRTIRLVQLYRSQR